MESTVLSPAQKAVITRRNRAIADKALKTAAWARIMTKWLVTHSSKGGVKWKVVDFNGPGGQESKGIVDLIAIRKNHNQIEENQYRGDLFEMVLIQVKGGSAKFPTPDEIARLMAVKDHHNARSVVLVEWKKGTALNCYLLPDREKVPASSIFGAVSSKAQPPKLVWSGASST